MNTRILMVLKVSMLLPWLLPVDRSEYVNRHITARSLDCFPKNREEITGVTGAGIELTASTFSENLRASPDGNEHILRVKFALKTFRLNVESYDKIEIFKESELSNSVDLPFAKFNQKWIRIKNLKISKLLGWNSEPCANTNSVKNLLQGTINLVLIFNSFDTHNAATLQTISIERNPTNPNQLIKADGDFPFEIEFTSSLKRFFYSDLVKASSEGFMDSECFWKEIVEEEDVLINDTKILLMRKDLATICDILNALQDRFKNFTDIESKMLRYKWFQSTLSEDPKSFWHYYYEGLAKVYDPFRSTREYYLAQPEGEDKRPSMCSELLIAHLKSLVLQGDKMLNYLAQKSSIEPNLSTGNSGVTEASTTFFLEMLSKLVKSKVNEDILEVQALKETHAYFERIVQDYQSNKGEPGFTGNPLQSLNIIFKKLSESPKHNSCRSAEDRFNFFKLDQGCVLTNYLKLCSEVTGENWDMDIQLTDLLEKQAVESLELKFVKKPMLELIEKFYEFLRLEEFNNSKSKKKHAFSEAYKRMNKNIDAFFKSVRFRCAKAYYNNMPFNDLEKYTSDIAYGWVSCNKTTEAFENDAKEIRKSAVENWMKIVGSLGKEGDEGALAKFYDDVLIQECLEKHYENFKRFAGISTLLEKGAQSILGAVLNNLKEKIKDIMDEGGVELLKHLIVIGELIDSLLTHSKNYRYLEILGNGYYRDMSKVSSLICMAQEKGGYFDEHARYINEIVQKAFETEKKPTGGGGGQGAESSGFQTHKSEDCYRYYMKNIYM